MYVPVIWRNTEAPLDQRRPDMPADVPFSTSLLELGSSEEALVPPIGVGHSV